jgi:hypothetical protein
MSCFPSDLSCVFRNLSCIAVSYHVPVSPATCNMSPHQACIHSNLSCIPLIFHVSPSTWHKSPATSHLLPQPVMCPQHPAADRIPKRVMYPHNLSCFPSTCRVFPAICHIAASYLVSPSTCHVSPAPVMYHHNLACKK